MFWSRSLFPYAYNQKADLKFSDIERQQTLRAKTFEKLQKTDDHKNNQIPNFIFGYSKYLGPN